MTQDDRIALTAVRPETWPLKGDFRIARGAKREATVVTVELTRGGQRGRGECCPYPRYGETVETTIRSIESFPFADTAADLATARTRLHRTLPAGAARNALDCALWDLEAKLTGRPVWQLAGLPEPQPALTCFTLSLDAPQVMADAARRRSDHTLLKLKLGDALRDPERLRSVRAARPDARLVCDVNEGWSRSELEACLPALHEAGVELLEQPLPAAVDASLAGLVSTVPICADEAAAPGAVLEDLRNRYSAVNIKLDKTGGLTAAIEAIATARRSGLRIMIGSMVSTSLSMAPAALLAPVADWIDLDSPLLLAEDRPHGMSISDGRISPPSVDLWG